jgi:hypothetical protein
MLCFTCCLLLPLITLAAIKQAASMQAGSKCKQAASMQAGSLLMQAGCKYASRQQVCDNAAAGIK